MYTASGRGGTSALGTAADCARALAGVQALRLALRPLSYALLAGLAGVLLIVATATVPVLFGYHSYVVNGGSMEPSLEIGSVAVTHPTSPRALAVGDIIAHRSSAGSPTVLHRIVAVTYEDGEPRFITQGDQNRTPDAEPIALSGPGDKVVYSVPYAGHILNFAQSKPGQVLLIGVPLVLLAALFLRPSSRNAVRPAPELQGPPRVIASRTPAPTAPIVASAPPIVTAAELTTAAAGLRPLPPAVPVLQLVRPASSGPTPAPATSANTKAAWPATSHAHAAARARAGDTQTARPDKIVAFTSPELRVIDLPTFLLEQLRRYRDDDPPALGAGRGERAAA